MWSLLSNIKSSRKLIENGMTSFTRIINVEIKERYKGFGFKTKQIFDTPCNNYVSKIYRKGDSEKK